MEKARKGEIFMIEIKKSFKKFNWNLFLVIFLTLLIPSIYQITRVHFVGDVPDSHGFSIAGNLQWINAIFEVLEEAILLPMFFTLGKILKLPKEQRNKKISGIFYLIMITYIVIILFCTLFANNLMQLMSVNKITNKAISFVRIELVTRFFVMAGKIGAILLIAQKKWKELLIVLVITTSMQILFDLFIVSNNSFSAKKDITWIAYDQLIVTAIILIVYIILIKRSYYFKIKHLIPIFYLDLSSLKNHLFSGLESFIRNAFFIFFVIKTINKLDDGNSQGDFWVMNTFIWSILLVPVLSISQYLNRSTAIDEMSMKEKLIAPSLMVFGIVALWLVLIPAYKPFIRYVMNNEHYNLINKLTMYSLGFYILMALNDPIDKTMYGTGKAHYMLVQSIIVNVVIYIPCYYLINSITIENVAIMMGSAIALDSLITFIMFFWYLNKSKLESSNFKFTVSNFSNNCIKEEKNIKNRGLRCSSCRIGYFKPRRSESLKLRLENFDLFAKEEIKANPNHNFEYWNKEREIIEDKYEVFFYGCSNYPNCKKTLTTEEYDSLLQLQNKI